MDHLACLSWAIPLTSSFRCCCKFFVLPLFSLIFARFSSVPMKLQDGSSSLKRLFSAKFLKKMSKNQKEVPRAKNTKDFSEKQRGKKSWKFLIQTFPETNTNLKICMTHPIALLKYSRFIATPFSHIPRATVSQLPTKSWLKISFSNQSAFVARNPVVFQIQVTHHDYT